jgi:hypothetical protein
MQADRKRASRTCLHKLTDLPDLVLAETLAEILREAGIGATCAAQHSAHHSPTAGLSTVYLQDPADVPTADLILREFIREVVDVSGEIDRDDRDEPIQDPIRPVRRRHSA